MKTIAKFEKVSFEEWSRQWEQIADILSEETGLEYCADPEAVAQEYANIKLPERATDGSAGYDFFSARDCKITPKMVINAPTGIRCKIEKGYYLELVPKSGLGTRYGFHFRNTLGIIDSDYYSSDNEGHIMFCPQVSKELALKQGDKMFQGILKQYFLAEEEPPTVKRNGGHGSTGR